jgi:hypothetical protein
MRPYIAIIYDAFAEALASRVLWILMILITLVLLGLAPVGLLEQRTTKFRRNDLVDARGLIRDLHEGFEAGGPSPEFQIWSSFEAETREKLLDFGQKAEPSSAERREGLRQLVDALNSLLPKNDLYQPEDWAQVALGSEAEELLEKDTAALEGLDRARLNRLLVEKPFPTRFQPQSPRQVVISYFGAEVSPPLPLSRQRAIRLIEKFVLPIVMSVLVGFIAILAAILVTAPIIPQMFDPGSLSLLLSKPLSRSLMFLAKFAGGCAFILINVAYLIAGLWLIVGLRFDVWNQGLLLCIPIFLFLFAIYYSVSAFAGVVWRNAVVSIVMTVLFWLLCTTVGATKAIVEQFVVETRKIVRIVPAGDELICADQRGTTVRWKPTSREWEEVFLKRSMGPMARVLGPIYDPEDELLMAAQAWNRGFLQSGIDLELARGEDDWSEFDGPQLPDGTLEILPDPQGRLLAVTNAGIERWVGEVDSDRKKLKVFFMEIPQTVGKPFQNAGPGSSFNLAKPAAAAVDSASGNVVTYGRGTLSLLTREGDQYELAQQVETKVEPETSAVMAIAGGAILVALSDGRVMSFDAKTLELLGSEEPEPKTQPRFVRASADGNWFAVVFHNGKLYLWNTQSESMKFRPAEVRGQGTISRRGVYGC